MRFAIISDIHGNLTALEAVLTELEYRPASAGGDVDKLVCLGDVAAFGPQPRQVLARLQACSCPVVMGNTDAWLLDPRPHEYRDQDTQRITEIELWCAQQLSPADLEYVRTLPPTVELPLGDGVTLLCYHGSPLSNTDVITSTTPDDELERMLAGFQATVMAGGHTHAQMLRRFGHVTLINPGSTGLPYERNPATGQVCHPPWAEYALVEWQNDAMAIEFRRAPFDLEALIQAALESDMPHAEWWIKNWSREVPC
jgi:predicted phosphodiesterase